MADDECARIEAAYRKAWVESRSVSAAQQAAEAAYLVLHPEMVRKHLLVTGRVTAIVSRAIAADPDFWRVD
jgi:hypothetical protein